MVVLLFVGSVYADITQVGAYRVQRYVMDVEVDGDYAYAPDYYYGLHVVDISNPANPVRVGATNERRYFRAIAKEGDYIYTAESNNGLGIYDVSDPTDPIRIGNVRPASYFYDVAVEGDYAYLLSPNYGLYIIDISNPYSAFLVSHINVNGNKYGLEVENGIVCIGTYYYGVAVIDATDPAHPVHLSSITGNQFRHCYGLDIVDGIAYVADLYNGLQIVDISDPDNPEYLGGGGAPYPSIDVTVEGNYAFLSNHRNGFKVFDISDLENPTLEESINTPYYVWNIDIEDGLAYVADYHYYMRIYDVSEHTAQPEIAVDPEAIDFSDVEFRRSATETFTISNVGNADLTVSDLTLSGDYYDFDFGGGFVLTEGESQEITVSFDPEEVGELTGEIVISSDDADDPEVTIAITGDCVWVPAPVLVERLIDVCGGLDLNRGQRNSLVVKLEQVIRKFDRGQIRTGLNNLNAFMNHVTDFVEEGVLSAEDGGALIAEAQFIEALVNDYGVDAFGDGNNLVNLVPDDFYFDNCYPNPFNAETTISFGLPEVEFVSIKVYDMSGRIVADLANSQYSAARYDISWRAQDIPAGNYLIHLNAGEFNSIRKVALIK